MIARYTLDNTPGATPEEVEALNRELVDWLGYAALGKGAELTTDEANDLIRSHNAWVAHRRPAPEP